MDGGIDAFSISMDRAWREIEVPVTAVKVQLMSQFHLSLGDFAGRSGEGDKGHMSYESVTVENSLHAFCHDYSEEASRR